MSEKTIELRLPRLHLKQAQIKQQAKRFNVLNCGRRFGKDFLGHEIAIDTTLDGLPFAWFAPTYRMMLDTFEDISQIVRPIATRINASEHRIDLITKGLLDFWSLDSPDIARGRKYAGVVINEAAMVPQLLDAWNAVIRPTLADLKGVAWFLSTPKGRNGFATLCQQAKDNPDDWSYWHFTTSDNPYIAKSEIEAMKDSLPERTYRQEVLAEFLEGQGSVFRNVRQVCTQTAKELPEAHKGHHKVAGIDLAKSEDFTRVRIGCEDCHRVIAWDGFNKIDYTFQVQRMKALLEKYEVSSALVDATGVGDPVVEMMRRDFAV